MKEWIERHLTLVGIISALLVWGLFALIALIFVDDTGEGVIVTTILWLAIMIGKGYNSKAQKC